MKLLVLGAGNAGLEVAARGKALGWEVVGTTTTPARVPEIEQVADRAVVLVGSDRTAVRAAAEGCDAVLVSVSPPIMRSVTVEDRAASYESVLVQSCLSAAAACERVVFMSSISVYGDGTQEPGDRITEQTPRSTSDEPSTVYYSAAEDAVLAIPGGTVLRLPDIYGHPRDIDFTSRVRLANEHMGGSVAFAGDGRLHRIHVADVARALIFVLEHDLTGVYNTVPDVVASPTNQQVFDRLADASGSPGWSSAASCAPRPGRCPRSGCGPRGSSSSTPTTRSSEPRGPEVPARAVQSVQDSRHPRCHRRDDPGEPRMKLLILGCGQAGMEIARLARGLGWEVTGTTTTPARLDEISAVVDHAVVLVGSDREAVKAAAEGADAIVVSVSPSAVRSANRMSVPFSYMLTDYNYFRFFLKKMDRIPLVFYLQMIFIDKPFYLGCFIIF